MTISAGTYKAKIVGAFVGESKEKKTPYYGLELELENGESIDSIHYLTEGTKERALKTLVDVGFKMNHIHDLADTSKSIGDLFDSRDDISVVIELESYQDANGVDKQKPVVKWVNVGGKGNVTKFDKAQAVRTFAGLTLDGDLARIKKGGYVPQQKAAPATAPAIDNPDYAPDQIPF